MSEFLTPYMTLLIVAAAAATYLTRIGGYLLIARLKTVPPRLERAERRSGGRADDARRARLLYRGTAVKVAMRSPLPSACGSPPSRSRFRMDRGDGDALFHRLNGSVTRSSQARVSSSGMSGISSSRVRR